MFDNLWKLDGYERLAAINEMKLSELERVCSLSKHCSLCPFSILYFDVNGHARLLCVDVATSSRIMNALKYGGRFLKKGERLGDEI